MTRDPERTRARILDAAVKEFSARGFAGARVDAIARRARVNKRMLYHYFGDKAALFREILRRKLARKTEWLRAAPDDPAECLPYWYAEACADVEWVRLLQWEALEFGAGRVIGERERRAAFAKGLARVRRDQARGLLSSGLDPAQLLLSLMALTTFPLAFPQTARLVTGLDPGAAAFRRARAAFLRRFAEHLRLPAAAVRRPAAAGRRRAGG